MIEDKYDLSSNEDNNVIQDTTEDSEPEIGCGFGNCKYCSQEDVEVESFTINVFFDGTGNNLHNTEFKLQDQEYRQLSTDYKNISEKLNNKDLSEPERADLAKSKQQKKIEIEEYVNKKEYKNRIYLGDETSYDNEFSNVALLHLGSDKYSPESAINIYIQGAGTTKDELDDTDGLAFAEGESGVHSRVNEAFNLINNILNSKKNDLYEINVFGFSRGSFYARVFCAWLKQETDGVGGASQIPYKPGPMGALTSPLSEDKLVKNRRYSFLKEPPQIFKIQLVGIYDTVSSHGKGHYNDPKTFPLDITNKKEDIFRIVHLTAQNDYRDHFPLTHVTAALEEGISVFECSFPGAHSNLGGAYSDFWQEENHYLSYKNREEKGIFTERSGEIDWRWWKDKGYYYSDEITSLSQADLDSNELSRIDRKIRQTMIDEDLQYAGTMVQVANRTVRYHYQFIMLNAMKLFAEEIAQINFPETNDRYIERQQIFMAAKNGTDLSKDKLQSQNPSQVQDARGHNKTLTKKKAQVLKKMDEYIQDFIKDNLDTITSKTPLAIDYKDALSSLEEQKILYSTFICNSLNPIYRNLSFDKDKILRDQNSHDIYDIYDIQPHRKIDQRKWYETVMLGRSPGVDGVENEGTSKNKSNKTKEIKDGKTSVTIHIPKRPEVEGG